MEKPIKYINEVLSSFIHRVDVPSHIKTFPGPEGIDEIIINDSVIIIIEGHVQIFGRRSNLLLGDIKGPFILGLTPEASNKIYVSKVCSSFSYVSYPRRVFFEHIERECLWFQLFHILSYTAHRLAELVEIMKSGNLYGVVKSYLLEINKKKCNDNICNYIVTRTGYSKSGVMTILKELRKGGYIDVHYGRLIRIKSLPMRF